VNVLEIEMNDIVLAADLGGTKSYLALFSSEGGARTPLAEGRFVSGEFASFSEMAQTFLAEQMALPRILSLGVAGPVFNGSARVSKLSWNLSEAGLKREFGVESVLLMNDLAATAYGINWLLEDDLVRLTPTLTAGEGPKVVVAPGTGLGEAVIHQNPTSFVQATEGGHTLFAPRTPLQYELGLFAYERLGEVTYDQICCGGGISLIYDFLRQRSGVSEPGWLTRDLAGAQDRTPVIVGAALSTNSADPCARQTLEIFCDILAAECTNFVLKNLASGGVYLGGGIPGRIIDFLRNPQFLAMFRKRPPLDEFLSRVPLTVIINKRCALTGAAAQGLEYMAQMS